MFAFFMNEPSSVVTITTSEFSEIILSRRFIRTTTIGSLSAFTFFPPINPRGTVSASLSHRALILARALGDRVIN